MLDSRGQRELLFVAILLMHIQNVRAENYGFEVDFPKHILSGVKQQATFTFYCKMNETLLWPSNVTYQVFTKNRSTLLRSGTVSTTDVEVIDKIKLHDTGSQKLEFVITVNYTTSIEEISKEISVQVIPAILSVIPPLSSIVIAIISRQAVVALFLGVWLGGWLLADYNPIMGFFNILDKFGNQTLSSPFNANVIWIMIFLGGSIGLMMKSGGSQGLAQFITKYLTTKKRAKIGAWLFGLMIFFADNENNLIMGTTMRPIMDKLHVSREKLAFIADSTSAPVASVSIVSGWIGFEVSQISQQFTELGISWDPYIIFLKTIPHRFYPILLLSFIPLLTLFGRDFGPMWKFEREAGQRSHSADTNDNNDVEDSANDVISLFTDKAFIPDPNKPQRPFNVIFPVLVIIVTTITGMFVIGAQNAKEDGLELSFQTILESTSSTKALLWASLLSTVLLMISLTFQRILTFEESIHVWIKGVQNMTIILLILLFAWSLGNVCSELQTAKYVVSILADSLPKGLLPMLVFLACAVVSFSTGTSWGTMGVLFPLVMPLAHALGGNDEEYMVGAVASILSGSIWGDHCSPISDTTITAALGSSCEVRNHVITQLPYAIVVGLVATFCCSLPVGLGNEFSQFDQPFQGLFNAWIANVFGIVVLVFIILIFGRKIDSDEPSHFSVLWDRYIGVRLEPHLNRLRTKYPFLTRLRVRPSQPYSSLAEEASRFELSELDSVKST